MIVLRVEVNQCFWAEHRFLIDPTGWCYAGVDSSARMLAVCAAPSSSAQHMDLNPSKL